MSKSPEIFQKIEKKLSKVDYASSLPAYHPAKGQRRKTVSTFYSEASKDARRGERDRPMPSHEGEEKKSDDITDISPEIERPSEREIDPEISDPGKYIPTPDEEEIPEQAPEPEIDDPDKEEMP